MRQKISLVFVVLAIVAIASQSFAQETTMRKTYDNPKALAPPLAHYSNVVRLDLGTGTLLFIAGSVAVDAKGNLVGKGDMAKQIEQVLKNISTALEAHGATMGDVVRTTTYMTDISKIKEVNKMKQRFFPNNPPTSTTVEVKALANPDFMVEIEAVAATTK